MRRGAKAKFAGRRAVNLMLTIAIAAALFTGCGDTSPGGTVKSFIEAALDEDCERLVELSSTESLGSQTREDAVRECEETGLTTVFESFDEIELEEFETLEEEIARDEATVKVRITMKIGDEEETFEETFLLQLEGEEWRVSL